MSSLAWKINRLRVMGMPELAYRVQQTVHARWEHCGFGLAQPCKPAESRGRSWSLPIARNFDIAAYIVAADAILDGRFDVFAMRSIELGFPPQWNRDCRTGIQAPMIFGKALNYRDERLVGNIKYLWEPNRHLELVTLAQAWYLSRDPKYAEACRILLDSWFEQCPYPLGPNWTSSLEHAVRLVNWSFAWHLLGGNDAYLFHTADGQAFRGRWLDMVYRHCHFIAGHLSKYSSANNHLLGEYMGLLLGSLTWPVWKESRTWRDLAFKGFESEALKQNAPDGVNREQTSWYLHEVADMMLICGLAGKANGIEFSREYWDRLESMMGFIASIMDAGGHVPMIGDADDAVIVRFSREQDFNPYRSLLATGAVLFQRGDFKAKAGLFDDKSLWLLGEDGGQHYAEIPTAKSAAPLRREFADGGFFVLGDAWGSEREVRLVADAGPLGYLSIAAHGHADALAFTLAVGGLEVLIDPGTYAYHTQKHWRDYFRGTSAHNTVRIDGLDQSVIGGNFMWLKHANAKLESFDLGEHQERLVGSHDGYLRLTDPVLHTRDILFDKSSREIRVRDKLTCKGKHKVEIHWHCHEDAEVSKQDSKVKIVRGSNEIVLCMSDPRFSVRLAKGVDNPPLGWVSRSFDCKVPTTAVVWSGEIDTACILETSLSISRLGKR